MAMKSHRAHPSNSLLDTKGSLAMPWHPLERSGSGASEKDTAGASKVGEDPRGVRLSYSALSDADGWLDLIFVSAIAYTVSGIMSRTERESVWFGELLKKTPFLLRDFLLLSLGYLASTATVYNVLFGRPARLVRPHVLSILRYCVESLFFVGIVIHARVQGEYWPFSQRLAWLLQGAVLTLKMHSYLDVKVELQAALAGCPELSPPITDRQTATAGSEGLEDIEASENDVHEQEAGVGIRHRRHHGNIQRPQEAQTGAAARISNSEAPALMMSTLESLSAEGLAGPVAIDRAPVEAATAGMGVMHVRKEGTRRNEREKDADADTVWAQQILDFIHFSFCPTLCYETSYPRTDHVRVWYLLEKTMLASCLLAVLLYVSSTHFLPVVDRINELSIVQAWGLLVIPTLIIWLSVFFLTFECITNAFAEMTHFAARTTYLRWWCSTSFLEFSRSWNLPVHTFLHKHVYQRIRNHGFDASAGRTITFLVSIVLHEILLWGLFGTGIPYLALFSLTQLPLMFIMKSKIIQGRRLGNLVFWAGMIMGTTLVTVLYAKDYCSIQGHCRVLPPPEL